jgi:ATP-dependent protease ClpP protease subunit
MARFIVVLFVLVLASCVTAPTPVSTPQEVLIKIDSEQPVSVKEKSDSIHRSMEVDNRGPQLSALTFATADKAFMNLWAGLSGYDQQKIWNDFTVLYETTDIREVHLYLSSGGGSAFDGLGIADQIERAVNRGFHVTAHASGIVASAAVPIFAVCSERNAAPATTFMVHETAMFKWGMESARDIRSQGEMMDLLRDRYFEKLIKHSKLTRDDLERMESRTTWFDVEQALEYGLVDKIE